MSDGRNAGRWLAIVMGLVHVVPMVSAQEDGQAHVPERVEWRYAPPRARFAEVITHAGTVYALDRQGLIHALDAKTGMPRWITKDKEGFRGSYGMTLSAVPGLDALFVACDAGLMALSYGDGRKLWHTNFKMEVAGPACTKHAVIAACSDGRVYGCDPKTGAVLWHHDYLEDCPEDPEGFRGADARLGNRVARPRNAATDGKIVVLSIFDQCRAIALDAANGKRLWDFQTKGWMYGTPAIGPRNVFVGSQDRHVYGIDKELGKLSWQVKTGSRVEASPQPSERFVYVGSCDAKLYAIDQTVGRVLWTYETEKAAGHGGPIYSRAVVLDGTVCFAAMNGTVYALDRQTGKLQWQVRPIANSELNSDLVHADGLLFVTSRKDGKKGKSAVMAIRAK